MHRVVRVVALVLVMAAAPAFSSAVRAADPAPLAPLDFLIGSWTAIDSAGASDASGGTTFRPDLQGRVIVRTNHAEYPATAGRPAVRHDDLMVIHAGDRTLQADYYDNEGHVIRYAVEPRPGGGVVFLSDAAAPGPRYRLTYVPGEKEIVTGLFEISPTGAADAFKTFLTWSMKRAAAGKGGGR